MKFQRAVDKLKGDIYTSAQRAIDEFEKSTGCTPTGIRIDLEEITDHDDQRRRKAVAAVRVSMDM